MKLIVVIDDEILPEGAEELEDALAEFLGLRGLKGKIDDELTGNTTVFPIVPDWIPSKSDYRYCEDCKGFFDFWKYGYNLGDAGHEGHKVREPTDEEYKQLLKDCEEAGCFEEPPFLEDTHERERFCPSPRREGGSVEARPHQGRPNQL